MPRAKSTKQSSRFTGGSSAYDQIAQPDTPFDLGDGSMGSLDMNSLDMSMDFPDLDGSEMNFM